MFFFVLTSLCFISSHPYTTSSHSESGSFRGTKDNPDPPRGAALYGVSVEGALTSESFSVGQDQEYDRYTPSVENPGIVIFDTISTFPIRSSNINDIISGAPCNHGRMHTRAGM